MDNLQNEQPRILLVKTLGRSTSTLAERIQSEERGEGPRGTLFERTLGCDVIDEATIANVPGLRGWTYSRLPSFVAQAMEARRRSCDYDVVVTWSERHTVAVAALFAILRVKTPHLAMMFWMSKPVVRIPLGVFRSGVDRIVTWSSVQRSVAVDRIGFPDDEVALIHHPVDLEFFHPATAEHRIIFSAGSTERDFPTLLEAVQGLGLPVRIAASLVVRLTGYRIATTDVRSSLTHDDTVKIEQMSATKLRDSYARAHLVVVPLLPSDIDAGVNVILEGMAMGRPVIASRTAGQVDVIRDGENARFVTPGNPGELRLAIESLLADPEAAEELGRRGRAYVEEHHRLEDFIENVRLNAVDIASRSSKRGLRTSRRARHIAPVTGHADAAVKTQ